MVYSSVDFKKLVGSATEKIKEKNEERKERKRIEDEKRATKREEFEKQWTEFENLIDTFEIKHLKDFCNNILGTEPPQEIEEDKDGRRTRIIKPDRRTFVDFIGDYFRNEEIHLSQIKKFALVRKIVTPSFFGEESEESGEQREFENIINSIKTQFEPEKIRNEEHLEAQLTIFLKAKYPNMKIQRQVVAKSGDQLDIVIDDKYVFELKVPKTKTELRDLSAQLEEYSEEYPNLCAVVADISDQVSVNEDGTILEARLAERIVEYCDKYKTKYHIPSIVLNIGMK